MINNFNIEIPKNIYFGVGVRQKLPEILNIYGKRVLFLTGASWFPLSVWKKRFDRLLKNYSVCYHCCKGGEPTIDNINEIITMANNFRPDSIIGLGGGSVLDTAKAVSGLIFQEGKIEDYIEGVGTGKPVENKIIPWIAMPTTSGSGAEVTKNSVIKIPSFHAKKSLRSPFLLAASVLVDPELTLNLPKYLSGISGMDALVQLIESFVSKKCKPVPEALIKQAFPIMIKSLKMISKDLLDIKARCGAAYGSLISGLALANSGLGAVHGFASGLGGLYDIPHGLICSVLINPVLEANANVIKKKIQVLLCDFPGIKNADPVDYLRNEIEKILKYFDITPNLKSYCIKNDMAIKITQKSSGNSMSVNPRDLSIEEKEKIILSVI